MRSRTEPGQFVEVSSSGWARRLSPYPARRPSAASSSCACVAPATSPRCRTRCSAATSRRPRAARSAEASVRGHEGHDILLVAGGLGIAPLRSLINNIHDERSEFRQGHHHLRFEEPSEVMFRQQFEMWRHRKDFDLYLTVDHPTTRGTARSAWSQSLSSIWRSMPPTRSAPCAGRR